MKTDRHAPRGLICRERRLTLALSYRHGQRVRLVRYFTANLKDKRLVRVTSAQVSRTTLFA